jgi:hypothetical protein
MKANHGLFLALGRYRVLSTNSRRDAQVHYAMSMISIGDEVVPNSEV